MSNQEHNETHKAVTLGLVKFGDYVRLKPNGPVYIRGNYCRSERKYELCKADDMNAVTYKPGTSTVYVGFTY